MKTKIGTINTFHPTNKKKKKPIRMVWICRLLNNLRNAEIFLSPILFVDEFERKGKKNKHLITSSLIE